jgi:N-methylhydantoinase A
VTDAQLVLGRLRPGPYAGGSVTLDARLAHEAIATRIAEPLGVGVRAAAAGIIRLASQRMAQAVEKISIRSGIDPRHFTLVACGGAGPMHGVEVARLLGMRSVHVPKQSGAFCAFGMLNSDVRQEFERPLLATLDDIARATPIIADLERSARLFLEREGFPLSADCISYQADLRYAGQQWTIRLGLMQKDQAPDMRRRFEAEHERLFGHVQPGGTIEITNCRVIAHGKMPEVPLLSMPLSDGTSKTLEHRPVHFHGNDVATTTRVVSGKDMAPGMSVLGPLIVEEVTTTIVVAPDDALQVDRFGDYLIKVAESDSHAQS